MEFSHFYMIYNIFNTYLLFRYLNLFFDRRETKVKIELLSFFLYYCLVTYLFVNHEPIIVTAASNTVFIILLSYNYKSNNVKRFLSLAFIILTLFCIEALVYRMTEFIEVNFFIKNYYSSFSGYIINLIVYLAFFMVISRFLDRDQKFVLPNKSWFLIFLLPIFSIYIIILLTQVEINLRIFVVVGMIALLFINCAIFYMYQSFLSSLNISVENKLIKEQNESYLKQLEVLKNSNDSIEELEHDLLHKLFSIKTLITEDKKEQCIKYIDKYLEVLEKKEVFSTTGNFVFDSIINYKLSLAHQKNIKPLLMIMIPPQLSFEPLDISALLGNLLDNAINAAENYVGDKWIDIDIRCEKGFLIIKIKNPYSGELNYDNGKIKTTKSNIKKHGIGLRSVDSIIEKYDGVSNIKTDSNIFQIDLLLVLEKC